ncbi:hypothetical protein [Streptomyces sp. MMBL 11-3]|uniref:hypothetical protein n=1 Tax=Streptomyces sp. MMBL 11-3 TaxID=3382639 RepID=UPI0039B4592E
MGGTALAALAAIGGLWAQAVASYWSQETAKDQLSQSRDASEQELQRQAQLVSSWVEKGGGYGKRRVHILNRSRDPVSAVTFYIHLYGRFPNVDVRPSYTFDDFGDLGPCTELVYEEADFRAWDLSWGPEREPQRQLQKIPEPEGGSEYVESTHLDVRWFFFTDRSGLRWVRKNSRLLPLSALDTAVDPSASSRWMLLGKPDVRTAKGCESSG